MTNRNPAPCLTILAILLIASPAWGGDGRMGAHALALGGAVTASPGDNAVIGSNPSALALDSRYDVHALGQWEPAEGWTAGASVADSRDGAFALGLSYARTIIEPPYSEADLPGWTTQEGLPSNVKRWHEVSLAAAFPLLDRKLSLGLGGVIGFADHDRGGEATTGNLDAGLAARPVEGLTLGLVGRNLLPLSDADGDYPVQVVGGARYHLADIGSVALDGGATLEGTDAPLLLAAGLEAAPVLFRIRGGWRLEEGQHHLSWGLGTENEAGGLDYAMVIPLGSDQGFAAVTHALSLRLYL